THIKSNFFFQAEDGIRDFHVTGVQTCALPILVGSRGNSTASRPPIHSRFIKKGLSKEVKGITTLAIPTVHPSSLRPVLLGMGLSNPRMKNGSDIYRIEQRTIIMSSNLSPPNGAAHRPTAMEKWHVPVAEK